MNWPYLHLVLNHFPIILAITGTTAALLGLALRRRPIWIYALATLTFAGLSSGAAFVTGNAAEDTVEKQSGIVRGAIDSHEEAAEAALWATVVMGVIAAAAWWRTTREQRRGPAPGWIRPLVLAAAIAGTSTLSWAAFLGGKIMHPSGAGGALQAAAPAGERERERGEEADR